MHWKLKAAIQTAVSLLPRGMSYATYYRLQRAFGGLRSTNPLQHFAAGIETWRRIAEWRLEPSDKVFFEVGTGRVPLVPLAYWLLGAKRTITMDVNPYLDGALVRESLEYIDNHQADVEALFGVRLQQNRLSDLLRFHRSGRLSLKGFLELCCIDYVEGGDAARTGLRPRSIDCHTSYTVFEHIPAAVLVGILREGRRIVRDQGLFVHRVDYSDHFSHGDSTISSINFLKYSDAEWAWYAGNRYMYMNRMRHDDLLALFQAAGHRILAASPAIDERARQLLESGELRLDRRFEGKSREILSITGAWIVSQGTGCPAGDVTA